MLIAGSVPEAINTPEPGRQRLGNGWIMIGRKPGHSRHLLRVSRVARLGLGPVLAVALTAGALSATPATAAAPVGDKPAAASTPVASRPDMYSARVAALSQGTGVEVNNLGDHYTKVVANPDGTLTRTITPEPSRVQQAEGSWADIDTTLANTGGVVKPTQPGAAVVLSPGGTGAVASVSVAVKSLGAAAAGMGGSADPVGVDPNPAAPTVSAALNWPTALPAPTLVDNVATYADVAAGTDLKVAALPTGFETSVVIKTRPSGPVSIALPYTLTGLRMGIAPSEEGGGVQIFDTKNRLVGQGGSAIAADATTDAASGSPVRQARVPLAVSGSGANTVLTVSVPASLLSDPATVFPVTIDPAIIIGTGKDTFVESSYPTMNFGTANYLKVGTFDAGASVARSYLWFPGANIQNGVVNSAQLLLWNWWTASCTPRTMMVYPAATGTWNPNKMTWSGSGPYTGQPPLYRSPAASVSAANGWSSSCPPAQMGGAGGIDVTSIAQAWTSGGLPNYGIGLVAANETDPLSWWQFRSSNWGTPTVIGVHRRPNPEW